MEVFASAPTTLQLDARVASVQDAHLVNVEQAVSAIQENGAVL